MKRFTLRTFAAIAGLAAAIAGCAEGSSAPTVPAAGLTVLSRTSAPAGIHASRSGGSTVSAVIGPEGGTLVLGANRVDFPAGALDEPTMITMRVNPVFAAVEMQPHGIRFPEGHEPVLTLDPGAQASRFQNLFIVYATGHGAVLEVLPTTRAADGTLTAQLHHFSIYAGAGS